MDSWWQHISRVLRWIVVGLGVLNVAMTFGSLLAPVHWFLDLMTHFTLTYVMMLALCLLGVGVLRMRPLWAVLFVVAIVPNLVTLYPYFAPLSVDPATLAGEGEPLTLVNINVSTANDHYKQVTDFIIAQDADIVALIEVRQDLLDHINETIGEAYPYVHAEPSRRTLGLAFVSKVPFTRTASITLWEEDRWRRQFLDVSVEWDGEPLRLFSVHPLPPLSNGLAENRNDEFQQFADFASAVDEPLVLVGDYNAVPWSHPVRALQADAGLRPAMLGYGVRPTWFFALVVQAPLDYMLVSDDLVVTDYRTGMQIGSDHLPVVAELRHAS